MPLSKLGANLKLLRESAGLSRNHIERNYKIPTGTVLAWESNKCLDIKLTKLMNYLDVYKKLGFSVTIDSLLSEKQFSPVSCKLSILNNFLVSSFGIDLLQKIPNILFYSDRDENILYLNPLYHNTDSLDVKERMNANTLTAGQMLLKANNEYRAQIDEVLKGKTVNAEYHHAGDHMLKIQLQPNIYTHTNKTIGFVATIVN
ncbi:MAG: hypothetical protein COA94_03240 [Rickettsiales bacterium]|nr:MAG: hypothetical protein COA94_03240 [Rickettsiales bacterium]